MKNEPNEKNENSEFYESDPPLNENDADESSSDSLSEEELNMLRASISSAKIDRSKLPPHDTSDKANLFRFFKKNWILAVCAVFIATAIVIGAIVGSGFLVTKILDYHRPFTVVIGSKKPYEVKYDDTVIDGVLYFDMRIIANTVNMIKSGSEKKIQFTSNNGTYLIFENDSSKACINGGKTAIYAKNIETGKTVSAKAYVTKDQCLVPFDFIKNAVSQDTLKLIYDEPSHTIQIRPQYLVYESDPDTMIMKEVKFITDKFDVTMPEPQRPVYTYKYDIDVSEYLDYMKAEHLLLANKSYHLGEDYVPERLTTLTCAVASGRTFQLQEDAAMALYAMMLDMENAGITDTYVTSAYRDYNYQLRLWNQYVSNYRSQGLSKEQAEEKAAKFSARPGTSEHQTGLCLDFTTPSLGGQLNEGFEKTDAFKWLEANAHKYGFILRYKKDKVEITGYDYEPWHYRFVGVQAASEMYHSGQCLEEYLEVN